MHRERSVSVKLYGRAGRLVPATARGLRARCVVLRRGAVMDWHSTQQREELLLVLRGSLNLQLGGARADVRRRTLTAGQCAFVAAQTWHRVVNLAQGPAMYLYVTAKASRSCLPSKRRG